MLSRRRCLRFGSLTAGTLALAPRAFAWRAPAAAPPPALPSSLAALTSMEATDKMKKVFEIEQRAQRAALAAARPGVEAQSVDAAARQVIVDAGFGPGYTYFTHRVGHGIGLDEHEWPYLVRGNTLELAPDMVFSDEPGVYIKGEFGIRLEDDMHITPDGAELLTTPSPSLEEPFGKGTPA